MEYSLVCNVLDSECYWQNTFANPNAHSNELELLVRNML